MIYAKFDSPTAGYSHDQEQCRKLLHVGTSYEMKRIVVGSCSSSVYLKDFPGESFNSVNFSFWEIVNGKEQMVDVYRRFYSEY